MKKILMMTLIAMLAMPALATAQVAAEKEPAGKAKMDTNGDGAISKAEFLTAQEERFATMDANKDGQITQDEYKAAATKWKEKRQEMRAKMKEKMGAKPAVETPAPAATIE